MPNDAVILECFGCKKMFKPSYNQVICHFKRGFNVYCSEKCRTKAYARHIKGEYSILVPEKTLKKLKDEFYAKFKQKNA